MMLSLRSYWRKFVGFMFSPSTDTWQSVLRIGLGIEVVFYALSSRADWNELFSAGGQGLINRRLTEAVLETESSIVPRIGWFINLGQHAGFSEAVVLWLIWGFLLLGGVFLTVGFCCRPAAIVTWFLHLSAVQSEQFLSYGMDNFTTIGLFYLMLSPLPDRLALDARLWKQRSRDSNLIGFFRRVLQLHVCVIYFFGGITKSLGPEWWNGTSVWRALTSPPYNLVAPEILVSWRYLLPVLGIGICVIETGYPFFIWWKRTRLFWLLAACGMHVGIAGMMGLHLFSVIMLILNLAAFGPGFAFEDDVVSRFVRCWPTRQVSG